MPEFLSNLDPIVRQVIFAVFPAVGLTLGFFGVLWWGKGGRPGSSADAQGTFAARWPLAWLGPIVVVLVSLNVFALLNYNEASGWPSLVPGRDVRSLWPSIVIIAGIVGIMSSLWRSGLEPSQDAGSRSSSACTLLRLTLRGLLAAGIAALVLRNVLKSTDVGSLIVTLAGAGLLAVTFMQGLERTAQVNRGFVSAVLMFIPVATAGQVILIGFTEQTPAFAMVAVSVIIAVAGVIALLRPRVHLAFGAASSMGLLLTVALFQSAYFGSASGGQAAVYIGLIAASVWLPTLMDIIDVRPLASRWLRPAQVRVVAALGKISLAGVPAAAALGAAIFNKPPF